MPADSTGSSESSQLPRVLLYATSSGLGGSGLDSTSIEGALAAQRAGFLRRVFCFANRQQEIPRHSVRSLQRHPVRLLSFLESQYYYAAKKRMLDGAAAAELRRGNYDSFHGWSGESFRSLIEARLRGIPSVIDVPTWHRNKGVVKPAETRSERQVRLRGRGWKHWRELLQASRLQILSEYDLADVLLMPSIKSKETFLAAGLPEAKLHYVGRGADLERYHPAPHPPAKFRAIFVGALIRRKGVHHLLAAWRQCAFPDGELVLVGTLHDELKPALAELATPSVKLAGFSSSVADELRQASVFVFPSECEGFAKVTIEAAACGLPLIATHESGDAMVDGETGWKIPANDPDAIAAALRAAAARPDECRARGARARARVEKTFSWDHYRDRILQGYELACRLRQGRGGGIQSGRS
ncbi:MAG TPA: glycosyltransferase family 4 protein [Verrucomicrobiaceae bacterium]|jgi:glycosyltransferase involved in cell wall biosynthesis